MVSIEKEKPRDKSIDSSSSKKDDPFSTVPKTDDELNNPFDTSEPAIPKPSDFATPVPGGPGNVSKTSSSDAFKLVNEPKDVAPKTVEKTSQSNAATSTVDSSETDTSSFIDNDSKTDETSKEELDKNSALYDDKKTDDNENPYDVADFKPLFKVEAESKIYQLPTERHQPKVNVKYPLIEPHAYAHIFWDSKNNELVYYVEQPILNEIENEILRLVKLGLEELINISFINAKKHNVVMVYLEQNVRSILTELGTRVSMETYQKIMYYVYRDFIGMNEIEPLLRDFYIEDIECNGTNGPLYVVHRKYRNLRSNVVFKEEEQLTNFVEKLAQKCGRYVSYASPLLDGTLPDGSRVNATYSSDVTTRGPTFTIRKFTKDPWTPTHLIKMGTASPEVFATCWLVVENEFNVMIVGETGSGKTTFLNSIASFIPEEARVCSIEDTRELNLSHENWLPSVTRTGFGVSDQKYGEISLLDLLRESFRQNPDYVIVGEVRDKETYVLFQGMASGHSSFSTFHAASVETLVRRLETPPISLPASLIESLNMICVVSHIHDDNKSVRRLTEIDEVIAVHSELGKVDYNVLFDYDPIEDRNVIKNSSYLLKLISKTKGVSLDKLGEEVRIRADLLRKMSEQNILDFKEFGSIINSYYKDKASVLKRFGINVNLYQPDQNQI